MKKYVKIILIIIIFILCITFLAKSEYTEKIIEQYKVKMYGKPIDEETGILNNEYFSIDSTGKNATNTTRGLQKALEYCKKNSIEYIKLEKGKYLINNTINISSNMELDLNSSIIKYETNNKLGYIIIRVNKTENVRIKNGILVGDKDTHNYVETSTHEWGIGIYISDSLNIELDTLDISNMTGDAIYITKYNENSKNIKIQNCILHNIRRQGISIISGEHIEICNNEIYIIRGTAPQAGIDLEANNTKQKIDDVHIHNNKFYDFGANTAIQLYSQVYNVQIVENDIYGCISIYETQNTTEIRKNNLQNGNIYANLNTTDNGKIVNNLYILENNMSNYKILYTDKVQNTVIENNKEK